MNISKLIEVLLILALIAVCIALGISESRSIYQAGFDRGYETCIEEYNLYE